MKPTADGILEAAEALFAQRGYSDVSLRQLIAAAGVSTTAFYARFESKAAVLDALTERLFRELQTEAAVVLGNARSLDDGIERGVDLLIERFGPRKALVRLIIAEAGSVAPTSSMRRRSYGLFAGFLAHRLRAEGDPGGRPVGRAHARAGGGGRAAGGRDLRRAGGGGRAPSAAP